METANVIKSFINPMQNLSELRIFAGITVLGLGQNTELWVIDLFIFGHHCRVHCEI